MTIPEHIELSQQIMIEINTFLDKFPLANDVPHIEKNILSAKVDDLCMYAINAAKANERHRIKLIISELR